MVTIMNIRLTARRKGDPADYAPAEAHSLFAEILQTASGSPSEIRIRITAGEDFDGIIRIAYGVNHADSSARFFLPGFMYGTNRGDAPLIVNSKAPRLRMESNLPASPWWMVRSDRLSHPCAMMYLDGRILGISASPYYVCNSGKRTAWQPGQTGSFDQYAGFGCSLADGDVWYTLGYENAPWMFVDSHHIFPRKEPVENCFRIGKGETVEVVLHCFDLPAEDERTIHDILKWVYARWHEPPRRKSTVHETVRDIAIAISRDAWLPESHGYTGFVFDRETYFENRLIPSITWTNGLAAAVPMLLSARRLHDRDMRAQALDCIDHIVNHCINSRNGLPYLAEQPDGQWNNRGWWYDIQPVPGHAAYLVGQAVYLVLKAYECEKAAGTVHENWLGFARDVIARTEKTRSADGEYPYIFSESTGAGLEYDSFSGAWCMAAAARFCRLAGERAYIPGLLQSEKWYHNTYIRHETCYGGPLDIDKNVDSEGILAYIRAIRDLHEIAVMDDAADSAGRETLLDHLRDALYYEFTFKFCYNSPIRVPPLSTVGWSSCGGSITSVTNPHIHPMSSSVMDEMSYYLRFRDDGYIRNRLEDTRLWSCQCHNTRDGEFGYGKTGWMSERFCHSEGLLTEKWPDGSPASTWFALMPWACGSILEGLAGEAWQADTAKVRVYTRPVDAACYPEGLARSVHFAFEADDTGVLPFNKNYGILFAEGSISGNNTIIPAGVRNPRIFHAADGAICVCAERTLENGNVDETAAGSLLLWKTGDLIRFESAGLVSADTVPAGASDVLVMDRGLAETALRRWSPVVCTGISIPEEIRAQSPEDLLSVPALFRYSDGSVRKKKAAWNPETVHFDRPGVYPVRGTVTQRYFRFPLAEGYGDPVIFPWEGKWYYISTNDNRNDIGLYVREADSVEGLFAEGIAEHLILPFSPERGFEQTFWAPEFHVIGGELYLLFAVSGHAWGPQCHMMKKKKTGRIIDEAGWEEPVRVVKKDGSPLAENAITLDMTFIRAESGSYVVWSYREHIGTPMDSGSMLYIASIDERTPWRLAGDPVLLTRPLYGWENVEGTINNEGPYAFVRNGKVYLTYSGGSANRYTYALGLLTADTGSDLSDLRSWSKSITPVLTFYSVDGEFGPGHNSFYTDPEDGLMIAYHAETGLKETLRCDGIRRVHFRPDGSPCFGISSRDEPAEVTVESRVVIQ